jgi:hypothetical protein
MNGVRTQRRIFTSSWEKNITVYAARCEDIDLNISVMRNVKFSVEILLPEIIFKYALHPHSS